MHKHLQYLILFLVLTAVGLDGPLLAQGLEAPEPTVAKHAFTEEYIISLKMGMIMGGDFSRFSRWVDQKTQDWEASDTQRLEEHQADPLYQNVSLAIHKSDTSVGDSRYGIQFGGGKRMGKGCLLGADIFYDGFNVCAANHDRTLRYQEALLSKEYSSRDAEMILVRSTRLALIPMAAVINRLSGFTVLGKFGAGMLWTGMDIDWLMEDNDNDSDGYSYSRLDNRYFANRSCNFVLMFGAEAIMSIFDGPFVASLAFDCFYTKASVLYGTCYWDIDDSVEGSSAGRYYGAVMDKEELDGSYEMMVVPKENIIAYGDEGWQLVDFSYGSIAVRLGVGVQF